MIDDKGHELLNILEQYINRLGLLIILKPKQRKKEFLGGGGVLRLIYGGPKCWMMLLCIHYICSYFIVPYLNFCCEIWDNNFNSITKPLFLLQNIEGHFEL